MRDIRFALRAWAKKPLFAVVAVVTLGLGIGANTAVFSVINAVLLRPLPYEAPDRLTLLWTNFGPDLPQNWISGPEFVEMRELNTLFEDIAIAIPFTISITGDGEPEEVGAVGASANFFDVFRVQATQGRLLADGDDAPGADAIAVLSHGYWMRRYGGQSDVIGRTIRANGLPLTIVGVLPRDFAILHPDPQFPPQIDVWAPLAPIFGAMFGIDDYANFPRSNHGMRGFGRLKEGVTVAQAQADLDAVAARMKEKSPNYYDFEGWGITVLSMHDDLVEGVRTALFIVALAVGLVLVISCVNVANLMLAKAASREREIAVRTALGIGRSRLIKLLLSESLTLSLIGGAAGLLLAIGLVRVIQIYAPGDLPRAEAISIDPVVLLFTFGVSVMTGVLFGMAPAFFSLKRNLVESLNEGSRSATTGLKGRRFRTVLVTSEVTLALILLVFAGLALKSFNRLLESDPGYRSESLLTFRVSLPAGRYASPPRIDGFFQRLLPRIESLPGVASAGAISQLPLSGGAMSGTTRVEESRTVAPEQRQTEVDRRVVTSEYFRTMGVRLIQGRFFSIADHGEASRVAIVDEEFVRRFWPSEEPIGKRISIDRNDQGRVWREVVGVVSHSRHNNLSETGREQAYFPLAQFPFNSMYVAVQTATDPLGLVESIRNEVWALDRDLPLSDIETMQARVRSAVAQPRFTLLLLGGFASVALLLSAVGVYGVISYSVNQRSNEIGVRMAMGADSGSVRRLVLRQGLTWVLSGVVLGVVTSLILSRWVSNILYGIAATDPVTYLQVGGLLTVVGVLACYIPATRATRLNPVEALREE